MRTKIVIAFMAPMRRFSTGERVWDEVEKKWADVMRLPSGRGDTAMLQPDSVITLTDGTADWEQAAGSVYKIVPHKSFKGHSVCYEHAGEIAPGCTGYYCPELAENCFESELVLNI